jgi:hypothetical protein
MHIGEQATVFLCGVIAAALIVACLPVSLPAMVAYGVYVRVKRNGRD